jgi:hypothetical protein
MGQCAAVRHFREWIQRLVLQIFSRVGCDESGLGEEVGVERVERLTFVFCHDEFKPIDQCIVHAFVCAEARNADSA